MKRRTIRRKSGAPISRKMIFQPSSGEPLWDPENDVNQLGAILNWYSYNKSSDDAKTYFVAYAEHLNKSKEQVTHLKSLPKYNFSSRGWLARILLVNSNVPVSLNDRFEKEYQYLLTLETEKEEVIEEKSKTKPDVQKAIREQLSAHLGIIEGEIDDFLYEDKKTFSPMSFYKDNGLKLPHIRGVIETYSNGLYKELLLLKSGKDEQLNEAYNFLTKSRLNKFISFVELIINDAKEYEKTLKQISAINRKPRTRKPKPAGKQVEKLKYLREYENYKSIMPSTIVGSTLLVVYNIKYRMLGVYQCNNPHGFTVKGCTIQNFDETVSIAKKLRKPNEILPKIDGSGKVALKNLLSGIRAKGKSLTGRINGDTLLLKVL